MGAELAGGRTVEKKGKNVELIAVHLSRKAVTKDKVLTPI